MNSFLGRFFIVSLIYSHVTLSFFMTVMQLRKLISDVLKSIEKVESGQEKPEELAEAISQQCGQP